VWVSARVHLPKVLGGEPALLNSAIDRGHILTDVPLEQQVSVVASQHSSLDCCVSTRYTVHMLAVMVGINFLNYVMTPPVSASGFPKETLLL